LLYGSECWSLRKEDERRLLVADMSWLRRIIGRITCQHADGREKRRREEGIGPKRKIGKRRRYKRRVGKREDTTEG